uniref:FAD/NAD(P)-binding domain-containing protein n=1 Tax=Astyanax mexicanus TaxID=7994 RepID=A0A3B1JWQ3_ASTMX
MTRLVVFSTAVRKLSLSSGSRPKVCIVGGGPAGFYTAQHLLKVSFHSVTRFTTLCYLWRGKL